MTWYYLISIVISGLAFLVSLLNFRHNKDIQEAKDLKERFDTLEIDLDDKFDLLNEKYKLADEKHNLLYSKSSVLEERVNNEINASVKYRDKVDDKLDEVLRIIYAQK